MRAEGWRGSEGGKWLRGGGINFFEVVNWRGESHPSLRSGFFWGTSVRHQSRTPTLTRGSGRGWDSQRQPHGWRLPGCVPCFGQRRTFSDRNVARAAELLEGARDGAVGFTEKVFDQGASGGQLSSSVDEKTRVIARVRELRCLTPISGFPRVATPHCVRGSLGNVGPSPVASLRANAKHPR
jgi:hypothetical protein